IAVHSLKEVVTRNDLHSHCNPDVCYVCQVDSRQVVRVANHRGMPVEVTRQGIVLQAALAAEWESRLAVAEVTRDETVATFRPDVMPHRNVNVWESESVKLTGFTLFPAGCRQAGQKLGAALASSLPGIVIQTG